MEANGSTRSGSLAGSNGSNARLGENPGEIGVSVGIVRAGLG